VLQACACKAHPPQHVRNGVAVPQALPRAGPRVRPPLGVACGARPDGLGQAVLARARMRPVVREVRQLQPRVRAARPAAACKPEQASQPANNLITCENAV
jgi:hypothetical protein